MGMADTAYHILHDILPPLLEETQFSPGVNTFSPKINHNRYKSIMTMYPPLPLIGLGVDMRTLLFWPMRHNG